MQDLTAHVKWFTNGNSVSEVPSASLTEWLWVVAGLAVGVGLIFVIDKLFKKHGLEKRLDSSLGHLRPWVGTVVRLSTGALLVANFLLDYLYAPNIVSDGSVSHQALSLLMLSIGLVLLLGVYSRLAGAALIGIYLISALSVPEPVQLLDHLEYLGIGLYLTLAGGGKFILAPNLKDPLDSLTKYSYLALPALKLFVGLALIVLAFSEKLLDISLANEFLSEHDWNLLSAIDVSDRAFILLAGAIEALIGLAFVINKATRLSSLALLVVMVLTAILLGIEEVIGHLFALGLVFGVWVGTSGKT